MWTPKGTTRGNSDTNDGQAAGHEGPKNQNKEEQDLSDVERVEVESKPGEGSLYQWYFTELVHKVHEQQRRTLNASASDFYQGGLLETAVARACKQAGSTYNEDVQGAARTTCMAHRTQ